MLDNRWRRLVEWLLNNWVDLITLGVASLFVIRYMLQSPTSEDIPELATWILAVLGLIALSGLWERNRRLTRIEALSKEGRDLALRYLNKKVFAGDFFLSERPLTSKELSSANEVLFLGKVLARTSREFMYILGLRLMAGATVRFIILDPESDSALEQAVLESFDTGIDFWRSSLRTTETVIEALANTPNARGKVELGYLPFIPSFGLSLIDPHQPHGKCFVEIYQHRSSEPHPTFELRASDDTYWFEYFRNQFDILWASCRHTDLKS